MTIIKTGSKVNLGLKITGIRPDGYHELDSFFYPLSHPHDELHIEPQKGFGLRLVCENFSISRQNNIVNAAYSSFAAATGCVPGLYARLRKLVPTGAGLGGGSADAAFFLRWLNEYCGSPLSPENLLELGARVGADVPFFLTNRPARVCGKGEIVNPQAFNGAGWSIVLVWPGIHVSTPWAFEAWDRLHSEKFLTYPRGNVKNLFPSSVGEGNASLAINTENDLELPVFGHYPQLAGIRDSFLDMGAACAAMSGSGSTIYGLFQDICLARKAVKNFLRAYRHVYFAPLENVGM